jgi:undecaprenyl diphosphate synthase
MDGNNRWSKKKNYNLSKGYESGANKLIKITTHIFKNYDVKYISAFALSKNNLNRSKIVISTIKKVLLDFLNKYEENYNFDFKVKFIGDLNFLNRKTRDKIKQIENINISSKNNLIIFINYSGQSDITNSITSLNKFSKINELSFSKILNTRNLPNPDLLIRTGGFQRLSNFMLYQLAFTELYFTKKLWPELSNTDIDKYIKNFHRIDRKFGV